MLLGIADYLKVSVKALKPGIKFFLSEKADPYKQLQGSFRNESKILLNIYDGVTGSSSEHLTSYLSKELRVLKLFVLCCGNDLSM